MITTPNETRIWRIFKYCQQAFGDAGLKLSFPPNTDPRKTYKWRYLENFCDKIDEWGITESTAYRVIDAMVEHAKRHGQLHQRGIAILSSEQMLDIGYESLCRNEQTIDTIVERIRSDRKFILSLPNLDLLSARENPNSFTNLVKWATQGKISLYYIAISKSCYIIQRYCYIIQRYYSNIEVVRFGHAQVG